MIEYFNGDVYKGDIKHDKPDGFGVYQYANKSKHTGFFSNGLPHGILTYETHNTITKGSFRFGKKQGVFYHTLKDLLITYKQIYEDDKLKSFKQVKYIKPEKLITTYNKPFYKHKKHKHEKINNKDEDHKEEYQKCHGCYTEIINATNANCGHVVMCYGCLSKCSSCPICRKEITQIIKLYVS